MSIKHKLLSSWHKFLQSNFNTYLRAAPQIGKERRYAHIDIKNQFEQYEQQRKSERLLLIQYKQQLRKKILSKELNLIQQTNSIDIIDSQLRVTENSDLNQEIINRIRQQSKQSINLECDDKRKQIITQQLADIENSLKQIDAERMELQDIQLKIQDLEPDLIIVEGVQKKVILNMIIYYEFQQRHIAGVFLNPETKKAMEIAHYHIQNNLPLKRAILYEVVPELFEKEIGEMDEYNRRLIESKRPQLLTQSDSIIQVVEKISKTEAKDKLDFLEMLHFQEMEMSDFIYKKSQEFCDKHDQYLLARQKQGLSIDQIFESLLTRVHDEVPETEIEAWNDYHEIRKIHDDFLDLLQVNKVRVFKEQRELYIPEFVKQNEVLMNAWIQKWEQIIKNSFDLENSYMLPSDQSVESKLDKAITKHAKNDIQALIEESQQEYRAQLTGHDVPVRQTDRKQKDEQLVKKLQVMTGLMHSLPTDQETPKIDGKNFKHDDPSIAYRGEEGRIMIDELPKVLFLNNQDPSKYNLLFWATHFNIEPQKLKNIFNFISFPIISADSNKETSRILRFIQFSQKQQT